MLHGRRGELQLLDGLLDGVRGGRSAVLVVRGEAGVGKTALLDHVAGAAQGLRVVRAVGVESEMELPFAALHQLCRPMLDRLGRLPGPQRDALRTALGLAAGTAPDRFLLGLAVLSLLSEVAGDRPLVCAVDDAQWLDRASAQALAVPPRLLAAAGGVGAGGVRGAGAWRGVARPAGADGGGAAGCRRTGAAQVGGAVAAG